jgi:hypothetical protein
MSYLLPLNGVRNSDSGAKADFYSFIRLFVCSFRKFVFEVIPVIMRFVKSVMVRKERRNLTERFTNKDSIWKK